MEEICIKMLKAFGMVLAHTPSMADEGGGSCFYKGGLEGLQLSVKQSAASQNLLESSWLLALDWEKERKKDFELHDKARFIGLSTFWPPTCGHEMGSDREDKFADTNGQNEVPLEGSWRELREELLLFGIKNNHWRWFGQLIKILAEHVPLQTFWAYPSW